MGIEYLSDREWDFLAKMVKECKSARGRPPTKHRQIFDAIFWIAGASVPWRSLPGELGKWNTVYRQFKRWSDAGLWQSVIDELKVENSTDQIMAMLGKKAQAARKLAENSISIGRSNDQPSLKPDGSKQVTAANPAAS